jgi:hypothetical protein
MQVLTRCHHLPTQAYNSSTWVKSAILAGDPVAAAIANNATLRRSFFWVSHTFTHQNLNNATYSDARCARMKALRSPCVRVFPTSVLRLRASVHSNPVDTVCWTVGLPGSCAPRSSLNDTVHATACMTYQLRAPLMATYSRPPAGRLLSQQLPQ